MRLTILKVILWPRDSSLPPRIVKLEPGKINVLTGESGAGKSALTWIIDYALGSDKCSIPIGLIRNVTAWFGVHVRLAHTEMVIARANPEDKQSTNEMYWLEGLDLLIPPTVKGNGRVEDLKYRFNQLSHLPALDPSPNETMGRASFRDMAAFNFQPQHIVANPFTLFFKADTSQHREKLRAVFPLALGAVDADTLARQRELRDLEREYDVTNRELQARLAAASAWAAEVESYYLQARAFGLLPPQAMAPSPDWTLDRYIRELRQVPAKVRAVDLPTITEGTNEEAVSDLTQLVSQEDRLAGEIGGLRRRLAKLDQLSSSISEYGAALTDQEDRLEGVGWFGDRLQEGFKCPVCDTVQPEGNAKLKALTELSHELSALTASVQHAPPKLDRELFALRQDLREREAEISKVRTKRKYLEDHSQALAAERQRIRQIYLFVGRVEQALENVVASQNVDTLRQKLAELTVKTNELRRSLDPNAQRARLTAAIGGVSSRIAEYARELQLEHANENVELNVRELTLQFSPLSGRIDFLWELGSGQNWVGYHIAALLALHEHFLSLKRNPVPTFLLIDQPSQVYFPEAWPSLDQAPEGKEGSASADIDGVRRIFRALAHFMDAVGGNFQLIVTEHAGSITWRDVPHVHVAGNWRRGHDEFLIPSEWLRSQPG